MRQTIDNGFTARHLLFNVKPNYPAVIENQEVCSVFSIMICLFLFDSEYFFK